MSTIPNNPRSPQEGASRRQPSASAHMGTIRRAALAIGVGLALGGFLGFQPLKHDLASAVGSAQRYHSAPVAGQCGGGVGVPC